MLQILGPHREVPSPHAVDQAPRGLRCELGHLPRLLEKKYKKSGAYYLNPEIGQFHPSKRFLNQQ